MKAIKLVAVGSVGVGKTCMLIAYTSNAFPSEQVPTSFDNYTSNITIDDKEIVLTCWDYLGGDYGDSDRLRPLLYPQTDIFLVCFAINDRSSFNNVATKWVPEITLHCPGVPFLLIGTKIDLRNAPSDHFGHVTHLGSDPVTIEEGEAMAKRVGAARYFETSALMQQGLKEVFDTAARVALDAPVKNVSPPPRM